MYLELRELLAELAAVDPAGIDYDRDSDPPPFHPENLAVLFQDMDAGIRRRLEDEEQLFCQEIKLERKSSWFEAGNISEGLLAQSEYYIGIQVSSMDRTALTDTVHEGKKIKLFPPTMRNSAVPGVPLQFSHMPSPTLPPGFAYFEVVRATEDGQKLWKRIREQHAVVLEWKGVSEDIAKVQASLFAIMPKGT
jgi:predicted component of type VI protein secretion system